MLVFQQTRKTLGWQEICSGMKQSVMTRFEMAERQELN